MASSKRCPRGTEIQTVIFPRDLWNKDEAARWAREHGFRTSKIDETGSSYRFRQRDPRDFVRGSFRTIDVSVLDDVKAVVGCPRQGRESDARRDVSRYDLSPAGKRWLDEYKSEGNTRETRAEYERLSRFDRAAIQHLLSENGGNENGERDVLTTKKRAKLRSTQFALPATRSLPIHDAAHARNAAARLEQMRRRGTVTKSEYRHARAAIRRAERRFGVQSGRDHSRTPRTPRATRRRDREDDWHVLDVRTGCVCPVGSKRAAENRAHQGNRSAGEERLVPQRSGCTAGPPPEDKPIVFEAHDQRRRDPRTRNADLIAWYKKNGDLSMGRGFREEKVDWLRHANREPALAAMRRLGYRG